MARTVPYIKTGLWREKSKYHGTMSDPPIDHATKLGLLKDEYLLLQRLYEDFDGRVITIKGWSATWFRLVLPRFGRTQALLISTW